MARRVISFNEGEGKKSSGVSVQEPVLVAEPKEIQKEGSDSVSNEEVPVEDQPEQKIEMEHPVVVIQERKKRGRKPNSLSTTAKVMSESRSMRTSISLTEEAFDIFSTFRLKYKRLRNCRTLSNSELIIQVFTELARSYNIKL